MIMKINRDYRTEAILQDCNLDIGGTAFWNFPIGSSRAVVVILNSNVAAETTLSFAMFLFTEHNFAHWATWGFVRLKWR